MTWSDVTVAGAFLAGIVVGAAGTIRLTRIIIERYRS
jgi:hypothetical protein